MLSYRASSLFLPALLLLAMPMSAQQPSVDTQSVTITYNGSSGANTAAVHVANATNVSARISTNLDSTGAPVNSAASAPGVFVFNVTDSPGGATVNIGTDPNVLGPLSRRGATSYTGTILISATGCVDCIPITITLNITNGGSVSVSYNGSTIPSSGISLFANPGGIVTSQITLTSATPTAFQITSNQTWLSANPAQGQLTGSQIVTLTANAAGLPNGANTATLSVNAAGVSQSFTVTLNVGTGGGLTLSPNPMNFQYVTSTGSYSPAQTQFLTVSGASPSATFTATANSTPQWLLVGANGGTSVAGISTLSQLPVSVNVAALNLSQPGTYNGTIQIQTSDNLIATENVNLTVTASPAGGTGSLNFSVATPGGAAPPAQQITISGSGTYTAFAATNTCGQGWLQVTPASGVLSTAPATLNVQVFPGNIPSGTCTGSISISTTGLLQNGTTFQTVNVTMTIGGSSSSGGPVALPSALTFNLPAGGTQTQQIIVNGDGSAFTAQAIGTNLTVFPNNGNTPNVLTVTANSTSSSGTIAITSSLGTQNVNVTVNVPGGNVLTANPASLAYILQPGGSIGVQNISINASGDSTGNNIPFSVSSAPSFVSYSTTTTTTPSAMGVAINVNQLAPGFNSGNIVLTATNAGTSSTLAIPVTVLAPGTAPGLSATPNPVNMSAQAFGGPVTQTVSLTGLAGTNFTASTISTGNWLTVSPTTGTSPATLTLTANPATLAALATPYNATVTISANNGTSITIPVALTVTTTGPTNPVLSVTPSTLTFNYRTGDPAPTAQPIQISTLNGSSTFTAAASAPWINLSQPSGTTPSNLNVTLNTAQLQQGTQTGTITITVPGNNPQTVTVTANVTSPPALAVSTASTGFSYRTGDPAPPAQTVQVTSSGAALNFTVTVSNAPWLTVSPTSGTTPATLNLSVDPAKVQVGNYSATVTVNAAGSSQTFNVSFNVSAPLPTITEVRNGASKIAGPIAPGLIIVIPGEALGSDPQTNYALDGDIYKTALANTRVLVGGFAAPMVFASSTLVSAIVPYEIAGRTETFVQVEYLGQRSNAITVPVATTAPAIFTLNNSGQGPGAILNEDGSINSPDNPEAAGRMISVYATGEGQTIPAGINGKLADEPVLPRPVLPVTATISGIPAEVQYYGAAPGEVAGKLLVNLVIPQGATSGDVILHIGDNDSPAGVTVSIK